MGRERGDSTVGGVKEKEGDILLLFLLILLLLTLRYSFILS